MVYETIKRRSNYIDLYGKFFEVLRPQIQHLHNVCILFTTIESLISSSFMLSGIPLGALLGFLETLEYILLRDGQNKLR